MLVSKRVFNPQSFIEKALFLRVKGDGVIFFEYVFVALVFAKTQPSFFMPQKLSVAFSILGSSTKQAEDYWPTAFVDKRECDSSRPILRSRNKATRYLESRTITDSDIARNAEARQRNSQGDG